MIQIQRSQLRQITQLQRDLARQLVVVNVQLLAAWPGVELEDLYGSGENPKLFPVTLAPLRLQILQLPKALGD